MKKHILQRDVLSIERDIEHLESLAAKFLQPYYNGLKATGFDFTESEFHSLALGQKNLIDWLKEKTLAANPDFMPGAKREAKLRDIEIKSYTELINAQPNLKKMAGQAHKPEDIRKLGSNHEGKVIILDSVKTAITDLYTTYANDAEKEMFDWLQGVCDKANEYRAKYGFNPLLPINGLILFDTMKNLISANPKGLCAQMKKYKQPEAVN